MPSQVRPHTAFFNQFHAKARCAYDDVSLRSLSPRYCDGNSFSGNRDEGQQVQGLDNKTVPIYYRGRRNIDATLATLVKEYNFGKAENVLLTGCSVSVPAVHVYAVSCTSL